VGLCSSVDYFTFLVIREVVDLFRSTNAENHDCKPDKDCH